MHHQVAVAAISTHVVEGCVCSAPEPSPESLQQGSLRLCRWAWHSDVWQNLHWFISFIFHFGGG